MEVVSRKADALSTNIVVSPLVNEVSTITAGTESVVVAGVVVWPQDAKTNNKARAGNFFMACSI